MKRRAAGRGPDGLIGYMLWLGLALATGRLPQAARLLTLEVAWLAALLVYAPAIKARLSLSGRDVAIGVVLGGLLGAPVAALLAPQLATVSEQLLGTRDPVWLCYPAVLVLPLLEGAFFRGVLATQRGAVMSGLLYGAAWAALALAKAPLGLTLGMGGAMAILGMALGFVAQRLGLTAAIACQAALNLVMLLGPLLGM